MYEVFDSIQGEGVHVGRLATFVRLQGCNLRCTWCDTKQAWDPDGGHGWSRDEIVKAIFHPLVILTGGEPMTQDLRKLCEMLKIKKCEVHVETNGTIEPGPQLRAVVDFWTVSPKAGALVKAHKTIVSLMRSRAAGQIKFVIDSSDDMQNYKDLQAARDFLKECGKVTWPVVLQPCWQNPIVKAMRSNQYEARYKQMAYYIKQRWPGWDVRLVPQIHKLLRLDRVCHKTIDTKDESLQWKGIK